LIKPLKATKPKILFISHVSPIPMVSGQALRVYYSLKAAMNNFEVHFLTFGDANHKNLISKQQGLLFDKLIFLPSIYKGNTLKRLFHKVKEPLFIKSTGLKKSNYQVGEVELAPDRIKNNINSNDYNVVVFEYFHAYKVSDIFNKSKTRVVLDTHNIMWQTLEKQLKASKGIVKADIDKYRNFEINTWNHFTDIIGINENEYNYIKGIVKEKDIKPHYLPMGTDLSLWSYDYQPDTNISLAFYGGLSSPHNKQSALDCVNKIMPSIWEKHPTAKFYIIGSKPDAEIKALETKDERIIVTGFVEKPSEILCRVSLVLCPWEGTYGFRSRLIEVMAVGVPVVSSYDAVDGMDINHTNGMYLSKNDKEMIDFTLELLENKVELHKQSKLARAVVEEKYDYNKTYIPFFQQLSKEIS